MSKPYRCSVMIIFQQKYVYETQFQFYPQGSDIAAFYHRPCVEQSQQHMLTCYVCRLFFFEDNHVYLFMQVFIHFKRDVCSLSFNPTQPCTTPRATNLLNQRPETNGHQWTCCWRSKAFLRTQSVTGAIQVILPLARERWAGPV